MKVGNETPFITADAPAMMRICKRIHARRNVERQTLPPPEEWPDADTSSSRRARIGIGLIILGHAIGALAWFTLQS